MHRSLLTVLACLLFATSSLIAAGDPVDRQVAETDVHYKLPAEWKPLTAPMLALMKEFFTRRAGSTAMQKMHVTDILTRGDLTVTSLLVGPSLIVTTLSDIKTADQILASGRVLFNSAKGKATKTFAEFFASTGEGQASFDETSSTLVLTATAKAADGCELIIQGYVTPAKDAGVVFLVIVPAADQPARADLAAMLHSLIHEGGAPLDDASMAKLREGAPKLFAKPATLPFVEAFTAADKAAKALDNASAASHYEQAATIARQELAKTNGSDATWQNRLIQALVLQCNCLRRTADPYSGVDKPSAEALALWVAGSAAPGKEREWWERGRDVLSLRSDCLRKLNRPEAGPMIERFIAYLRAGLDKPWAGPGQEWDLGVQIKIQAFFHSKEPTKKQMLEEARESVRWVGLAHDHEPGNTSYSYDLGLSRQCLASALELNGDAAHALESGREGIQALDASLAVSAPPTDRLVMQAQQWRTWAGLLSRHRSPATLAEEIAAWKRALQLAQSLLDQGQLPDADKSRLLQSRQALEAAQKLAVSKSPAP